MACTDILESSLLILERPPRPTDRQQIDRTSTEHQNKDKIYLATGVHIWYEDCIIDEKHDVDDLHLSIF